MRLKLSNHLMLIFCVLVSKVVARGSMFGEKYWFDTSNLQVAWKWKNWYSHYFEWFCVNRFPAISMLDQVNYPWCFFVPFIQHAAQKWIVNFFVFLALTILILKNPFFSFVYLAEVMWQRDLSIGMFWRCERKKDLFCWQLAGFVHLLSVRLVVDNF